MASEIVTLCEKVCGNFAVNLKRQISAHKCQICGRLSTIPQRRAGKLSSRMYGTTFQ